MVASSSSGSTVIWMIQTYILIQSSIMGKLAEVECSPVLPQILKSLHQTGMLRDKPGHHRQDSDFLSAAPEESKIGKRDLWELVSSSSDVIPMGNGNNSAVVGLSSSPRYQDFPTTSVLPSTISSHLNVQMRLNKLQYYFGGLRIFEEDCKQRLICEISADPAKYAPLSAAFLDETSYNGDEKMLSARLLTSNEGTRLLTYMEAAHRGLNREGCDIWAYRCPQTTETLIDFKSLLTWREVLKWLTVKMVAKRY